jgi:hypothetical protein
MSHDERNPNHPTLLLNWLSIKYKVTLFGIRHFGFGFLKAGLDNRRKRFDRTGGFTG